MIVIREQYTKFGTLYEKYLVPNTVLELKGAIGFNKKSDNNKHYFIVMNQDGHLIKDACNYLNVTISNAGFKTREKTFSALKLLYSYCLVFDTNLSVDGFKHENLNKFISFLYGGHVSGEIMSIELTTYRRKETVMNYLRVYHNYFKVLFETEQTPFRNIYHPHVNNTSKNKYSHTSKNEITPMYFKDEGYKKIIEIVNQQYTIREHLIIHLMYEYGLRIGEVLGLTIEDLHVINADYKLYLRNRVSDKQWQLSKSLISPVNHDDYRRDVFNEYGSGFQIIKIDKKTVEMIDAYIECSRTSTEVMSSEVKLNNLNEYCNADSLDNFNHSDFNQYLFISKNLYRPLTNVGWNSIIREIFEKADIQIDKHRRTSNLNHKFRHSFAMNLVKKGYDPNQLAKKLRHKSVASTYKYYNPDEEDQYELFLKYKQSIGEKYDFEL